MRSSVVVAHPHVHGHAQWMQPRHEEEKVRQWLVLVLPLAVVVAAAAVSSAADHHVGHVVAVPWMDDAVWVGGDVGPRAHHHHHEEENDNVEGLEISFVFEGPWRGLTHTKAQCSTRQGKEGINTDHIRHEEP